MGIDKEKAIKKIQDSTNTEFEVFEGKEHETFLENYKDTVIAPEIREVHDHYDRDVKDLSGEDRNQNEKSYDYLKRVFGGYKTKTEKVTELETTIIELNKKIKTNSGDEQLKIKLVAAESELANVQEQYKKGKEAWGKERTDLLSSHDRAKLENGLDRSLMGIKFKDGITKDVQVIVVQAVKNGLLKIAEIVDGKMIFKDDKGNIMRNQDSLNPFTAKEMLKLRLKDIIDEGRKIEGTGVKPEITEDDKGNKTINYTPSDSVRTKDDLLEDLAKKGLVRDTEGYKLAWAKYSPDLKNV